MSVHSLILNPDNNDADGYLFELLGVLSSVFQGLDVFLNLDLATVWPPIDIFDITF
jgi:hypothetical protein